MAKMRAVQVSRPKGPFEIVQREIPEPGTGSVRIRVQACGVCHSDSLTKEGTFPGLQYPRIPGHEVVGVIDAIGQGVSGWSVGRRPTWAVARPTFPNEGANPLPRPPTKRDEPLLPARNVLWLPEGLSPVEAAPLMCAGLTTFNSLRNSGARPGDTVAVLGLGGLGHLGVQFAVRMGYKTVAIARGKDKEALARKLGAALYIDSQAQDPAAELAKLGGARVIVATVTNGEAMSAVQGGLGINGTLMILGAPPSLAVSPFLLISGRRSIKGWYSGTSIDSQETLRFSVLSGVRSMNEVYPLERVTEAYEQMMSGRARFRVVMTTGQ